MSGLPPYTLDDPRPMAAEFPYTYFLPSAEELDALAAGDLVKLVFRPWRMGQKWDAERMWVRIERVLGDHLSGTLDNEPDDIPGLDQGERIQFQKFHVVDCIWADERETDPPQRQPREYWDRCLVDLCVTEDGVPVHYLYRQEPQSFEEGDTYPDSGWRIYGDFRGLTTKEIDSREVEFVALGRVLNSDDSWLHLIDAPVGSAFIRDWQTGEFVPGGQDGYGKEAEWRNL